MKKIITFTIILLLFSTITFLSIFKFLQIKNNKEQHSNFYIEGLDVDDVIIYFNEVAFGAEIINSGNPNVLQKWKDPIYYYISGEYTKEDSETLINFINFLNTIEGFPGMFETKELSKPNLNIYFGDKENMLAILGKEFDGMDGGVTFWYTDNVINRGTICYRTDIEQQVRNSVIIEEIYNGLGLIQDTSLREDSIIYSGFSMPQKLTKIDELLIKLLYSKELKNGMTPEECKKVIQKLYY